MPKSSKRKGHSKKVKAFNDSRKFNVRKLASQDKVMSVIDEQAKIDAMNSVFVSSLEDHDSGKNIISDPEYLKALREAVNVINTKGEKRVEI